MIYEGQRMKRIVCIVVLTLLMFLSGCNPKNNIIDNQKQITFFDDLGREVSIHDPKRAAVLLGSFAHMWTLAGGEVIASADDAWEEFDLPLSKDAVNLGHTKSLSLEKLFGAQPDFVVASANTKINIEWKETLEKAHIPVAYFSVNDFDDYLRVLKICCEITGRDDLYEKNGVLVKQKVDSVIKDSQERIKDKGQYKILSLRASATSVRAKNSNDNVLGEMLKNLGCINIADSNESLLENISIEYIMQEDPDFIFFVQQGNDLEGVKDNVKSFINQNPAWKNLTAVKEGRVYIMDKALYTLKPNNRWGEAYEKLEEILNYE